VESFEARIASWFRRLRGNGRIWQGNAGAVLALID